jgi:putative ABC transport system permease protein
MLVLENIRISIASIRANTMRSILTTLGIVIGTASVIAVVSVIQGVQHMIAQQLQDVGANYIMVFPKFEQPAPGTVARPVRLTWEDGQALAERIPDIASISPVVTPGSKPLKYRDRQHSSNIQGVTDAWPEVSNHWVDRGRFFTRIDLDHRRKVIVVGEKVVKELHLGPEPVGKEVYLGKTPVTIIGVMEKKGQALGQDRDDVVFVPYPTALSIFGRRSGDQVQLHMQAHDSADTAQTKDSIQQVLRRRHRLTDEHKDDFQVFLQDELLESMEKIISTVTAAVGAVVSVALLVGGIGIMNIMLVSVTERTREIGIRKAVGARRQDILFQFLSEAITLSLLGGVIGIALGYGIGTVIANVLPGDWPPAHVPAWAIATAFGFCTVVGVFFGIYPAAKAAQLNPIDALRHE